MRMNYSDRTYGIIACIFVAGTLLIVSPSYAALGEDSPTTTYLTTQTLNVTNVSVENQTFPENFRETPTLIKVGFSTNDTGLDGPKGEMAATPRTIGFEIPPLVLAGIVILIIAAVGGWLYFRHSNTRKKQE